MFAKIKTYLTINNIVLVVAAALALSWTWSTVSILQKNYDLERQVSSAKLANDLTKLQNDNLKLTQNYYQTNEFLELQARTLLNKAEPGEHLVILPANNAPAKTDTALTLTPEPGNFAQWLEFLFGKQSS